MISDFRREIPFKKCRTPVRSKILEIVKDISYENRNKNTVDKFGRLSE